MGRLGSPAVMAVPKARVTKQRTAEDGSGWRRVADRSAERAKGAGGPARRPLGDWPSPAAGGLAPLGTRTAASMAGVAGVWGSRGE